ncbi:MULTISPECIES: hypothetical protein [Actinosynnema]|uniref:Uncharacterized protein n=1 Tax=Actinosynnema pretiosum TaxID=42197 RepID=A0A290ZFK7_9PSEU|nr:hypothetical protein [Actinosynnema pretiosum]ATE57752.1 hypothetical protein CNX65_34285 [Actinosynnema pretiosum]
MTFPYDRAKLDALVADVEARNAALIKTATEASRVRTTSRGLSDADLAQISRAANNPRAPQALRDLAKRVDAGELSWKDIAEGKALDDEGVRRAMATGIPDLKRAHNAIREGQDVQDLARGGDGDEPGSFTEDAW